MPAPAVLLTAAMLINGMSISGTGFSPLTDPSGTPVSVVSPSGCTAAAYRDGAGEIIVAYQGTYDVQQGFADLQIVLGAASAPALSDATSFAARVRSMAAGAPVYVTGFSLGATLAETAADRLGLPGAAFAGSGVPGHRASSIPRTDFVSYVERGDPWANFGTDTAEAAVARPPEDHVGTLVILGAPSAIPAKIVSDMQALATAPWWNKMPAYNRLATDYVAGFQQAHNPSLYLTNILSP